MTPFGSRPRQLAFDFALPPRLGAGEHLAEDRRRMPAPAVGRRERGHVRERHARGRRGMPVMAYSPVEQGMLADNAALSAVAGRHEATAAQVALAWALRQDGVIAIPKATGLAHVADNRAAADLKLTAEEHATLDAAFPPPRRKQALEMI